MLYGGEIVSMTYTNKCERVCELNVILNTDILYIL